MEAEERDLLNKAERVSLLEAKIADLRKERMLHSF